MANSSENSKTFKVTMPFGVALFIWLLIFLVQPVLAIIVAVTEVSWPWYVTLMPLLTVGTLAVFLGIVAFLVVLLDHE